MIRRYAKPEYHKQWIDIIDRGGSLQIHRDKIVHGDWGGAPYDVATKEIVGVKHLYDHFQQKGDYTWKLDYDAIFNVAKQIDKLVLDCFLFSMELMRPEDGDDVRPSLLRRLVSPDRPLSHRDRIASAKIIAMVMTSSPISRGGITCCSGAPVPTDLAVHGLRRSSSDLAASTASRPTSVTIAKRPFC